MAEILTYTGAKLANGYKGHGLDLAPYIPSESLVKAVNVTLFLKRRPILVMGEPGVGKTRLAESIAFEMLGPLAMKDNFFIWNIKSTSKAKDGLYRYDALRRLTDSQILKTEKEREKLNSLNIGENGSYLQYGVLGEAFTRSRTNARSVILIDEIDKADIDFSNDLLSELENYEFTIPETGQIVRKSSEFEYPIIIITSNQERELPTAFLRRCIYHYIDFPDDKVLSEIIFKTFNTSHQHELVGKALSIFRNIRESLSETEKKPSTSELLDWFSVLDHYFALKRDSVKGYAVSKEQQDLINCLNLLDTSRIPFVEVLLKTHESLNRIS